MPPVETGWGTHPTRLASPPVNGELSEQLMDSDLRHSAESLMERVVQLRDCL
jgi:hypothetical protein